MSHTPGPWQTSFRNGRVVMAGDQKIATAAHVIVKSEAWDNARLIAAAPELLQELKVLVEIADSALPFWSTESAKSAIAKAEGANP